MKLLSRPRRTILLIALTLFLLTPALAEAKDCSAHRFTIENELTGEILGTISTQFLVRAKANKVICLQGNFEGKLYRYEYFCNGEYGTWDFVRKMSDDETGRSCFVGRIR